MNMNRRSFMKSLAIVSLALQIGGCQRPPQPCLGATWFNTRTGGVFNAKWGLNGECLETLFGRLYVVTDPQITSGAYLPWGQPRHIQIHTGDICVRLGDTYIDGEEIPKAYDFNG